MTQVPDLYVSVCLRKLPIHIISHISASILVSNVAYYIRYQVGWEDKGGMGRWKGGRKEEGWKEGERGGGEEEQKGSFKTAETSSFHSPLLLHGKKKVTITYWKTLTNFSHTGFVNQFYIKHLFCDFLCYCSWQKVVGLHPQNKN